VLSSESALVLPTSSTKEHASVRKCACAAKMDLNVHRTSVLPYLHPRFRDQTLEGYPFRIDTKSHLLMHTHRRMHVYSCSLHACTCVLACIHTRDAVQAQEDLQQSARAELDIMAVHTNTHKHTHTRTLYTHTSTHARTRINRHDVHAYLSAHAHSHAPAHELAPSRTPGHVYMCRRRRNSCCSRGRRSGSGSRIRCRRHSQARYRGV
jgi:hypothetical protein